MGHAATKPDKVNIGITKIFRDQNSIVDTVADHKNNYFIGQIFVNLISNYHINFNFDWFNDYYEFRKILKIKKSWPLEFKKAYPNF